MGEKGDPERRSQYGHMGGIPGRGASGRWGKKGEDVQGKARERKGSAENNREPSSVYQAPCLEPYIRHLISSIHSINIY